MRYLVLSLFLLLTLHSCGSAPAPTAAPKKEFKMVTVPTVMTSPEERAAYLVENYWQNFDYADTSLITLPTVTEQAFVNFIDVLPLTTPEIARRGIDKNINAAMDGDSLMAAHIRSLYESYLYDPNSPMRNEDLYIIYLQSVIGNPRIDPVDKIRPQFQLDMALKNRVGSVVTDFRFAKADGSKTSLHSQVKSTYTLLFFNNPDCPNCQEIKSAMAASDVVSELTKSGKLRVVAVYTDKDLEAWHKAASAIPAGWVNGYTNGVTENMEDMYDLRAIPTLYLLDANKKVVLKDAPYPLVDQTLREVIGGQK